MADPKKPTDSSDTPSPAGDDGLLDDLGDLDDDNDDLDLDDFTDLGDENLDEIGGLDDDEPDDGFDDFESLNDDLTDEHDPSLDLDEKDEEEDDEDWTDEALEMVVMPWQTTVRLLADGADVPALLDPTRPDSTIVRPGAESGTEVVRLSIGPLVLEVQMSVGEGSESAVVLGRNALAGRVLVTSE